MADAPQEPTQSIVADPNVVQEGATEAVAPSEETQKVSKQELKVLLEDIVKDIHDEKVSKEHVETLRQEIAKAKQDLISVIVIAEETIKRLLDK